MGKVGSTALNAALKSVYQPVYQVHSLVPHRLQKTTDILNSKGLGIPQHVKHSQYIIEHYINEGRPVKFITPIRSPLERNMSAFFQELSTEIILKQELQNGLSISPLINKITWLPLPNEWKNAAVQYLVKKPVSRHVEYLVEYFKSTYRHRIPLDWFDNEVLEALDINVYSTPFDSNRNFLSFKKGNFDLLVLKSELSNNNKAKIISEFLEIPALTINNTHSSSDKYYSKTYDLFKSIIRKDTNFLTDFYDSKFVRTFYTDVDL